MRLSNTFRIDRPPAEVFDAFLDIERIAGCMPGSKLLGQPEKDVYDGEVKVKVGPLGVAYSGQLKLLSAEKDDLKLTMRATGREKHGAGNADAHVVAQLSEQDGGTLVEIATDLSIRGKVAQFGRGVIGEVTDGIIAQFAKNVEAMLIGGHAPAAPAGSPPRTEAGLGSGRPRAYAEPEAAGGENLDAWALIVRPMLQRHAGTITSVAVLAVAAYVGARAGTRRGSRRTRHHD